MRQWLLALVAAGALCVACFLSYPLFRSYALLELRGPVPVMEASVIIRTEQGKGSGIHIGGGFVLTAAHVVRTNKTVRISYYNGGTQDAEVLWSNPDYDVALVRVQRKRWEHSAPLDCSPNYVGQRVLMVGNPMALDFVYSAGTIVGDPIVKREGPWKIIVPLDGTAAHGQSGGAAIDSQGRTVGLVVAAMVTPNGIAGFTYLVPASVVCGLMGRA